ncbi:MAG TPA: chaperonin GroEL [Roseiflexaceae bacterium]|nr:chaperonin GroEL [Roseiflexaceae bacterium]
MTVKQLMFDEQARDALHQGVNILARAVRTTLGPKGRNVALDKKWGAPTISPDGVTVAKEIELEDPFQNMGAQLLKQAASKTSDVAGDGTTTSTVLAQALVDEGLRLEAAGANPLLLKRGLDKGVRALVAEIMRRAIPITGRAQLAQIATISAQDAEIGELLATIMDTVGHEAVISVEEGQGTTLEHELVEGMQIDRGAISPYFVTDTAKMITELEGPAILITEMKISSAGDVLPLLEALVQSGKKDLLLIAEDVVGEALAMLVVNKLRGTLNVLAIKAPGFGDRRKAILQDIAILTGGTVLAEEVGRTLASAKLSDLGHARRVRSDKDNTIIVAGAGGKQAIEARTAQLKQQIEAATSDYDREQLQQRVAKLSGGVAVIKVGAPTEPAMQERKARVDDALHATRAAIAEGIVPGGGVAYLNLSGALDGVVMEFEEDRMALNMLRRALEEPARQIAQNAGVDGAIVVDAIRRAQRESANTMIGFDAMLGEYGDLVQRGIIDPAKVVRAALENAVSVAGMILSTDALIADMPEPKRDVAVPSAELAY